MPGELFADRFAIERTAGVGGMGVVYQALDRRDGASVALKLLSDASEEEGLRFGREVRALAEIDHPGIVRFVDHGRTPEGVAWLAMEWLEGEDLGQRLARGPLPVEEVVVLGRRVAEALAAAHASGVVHRDVKPANLFLVGGDVERVKVIDFGVARAVADRRATLSGAAVGTPSYMAPEQARGAHDVDLRADVFSLGCVLFECLAGRPPFAGQHAMAVLAKLLLENVPPVRELVPGVPPALAALVDRMLAKDPVARPSGGLAVAAALEVAIKEGPGAAPALTANEQRLVSVVVATARIAPTLDTLPLPGSTADLGTLRHALAPFSARIEPLADGSLVAALSGGEGATDQAARAARCALAMRDALPEGPIALATGRGLVERAVPIGDAIDRAVELLRAAQHVAGAAGGPEGIVVDPVTAGLLDARFVVDRKGGLLTLTGEREALLEGRTLLGKPTPCVGRDREIAAIEAVLSECADDAAARAVLVTGPAGIGKSRLAHEVVRRAHARGDATAIWMARGDPMGVGSSRRLLAELAARAVGLSPGDAPAVVQDRLRTYAEGRLGADDAPRVAEFLGELCGAPFPDGGSVQLRAARQDARLLGDQIRRALEDVLEAECARGPVLVVLEDLHWADPPSVAFFDVALRTLAERPLMVLALARPEVRERFPRLWSGRGAREIGLPELSRKASERLARSVLGDDAPPAVIARLSQRSAGNPFYLEELIRAEADGHGGAAPETVIAMVQARLSALSPAARRTLRAGSVFGEAFWSGGVRALLGGAAAEAGDAPLGELEERELVRPQESRFPGERELCFRHALVREAAYGMLTPEDRATGHRIAGDWLEHAGERDATRLAEHFERGAEMARAAVWYQRGADQALEANDLEAVIGGARRARELGAEGETLGAALVALGEAHLWRGEAALAAPPLAEAMRLLPRGSPRWFVATMRSGWAAMHDTDRDRLLAVGAELAAALGPAPSGPALVAAARLANQLLCFGYRREAEPFAAALAPVLADPARDPVVAAHALDFAAVRAVFEGDLGTACAGFTACARCFDEVGDVRQAVRVRNNAACMLTELGRLPEAEADLRAVIASAERLGTLETAATARQSLATVLFHKRALPEARALAEQAVQAFVAQRDPRFEALSRAWLSAIFCEADDLEAATVEATRAVALCASAPAARCLALAMLARAHRACGLPGEARRAAEEATEILDQLGGIEEGEALVRLTLTEALLAAGERARASAAAASAREALLARAARIVDPAWRRSFLEDVAEHARTLALAGELG